MAEETLKILFSGPALSLLLYENSRTHQDHEGFLLGDVTENVIQTITDTAMVKVKVNRIIKVNSVVPCPKLFYFYDHCGRVEFTKLNDFLGEDVKRIVSWYIFKRSHPTALCVREKIVHKQLAERLTDTKLFTSCILQETLTDDECKRNYRHEFLQYCNARGTFKSTPMHTENLGDSKDQYLTQHKCSSTFNTLIASKIDTRKLSGGEVVQRVCGAVRINIPALLEKALNVEKQLEKLERNIAELKTNGYRRTQRSESCDLIEITEEEAPKNDNGSSEMSYANVTMRTKTKQSNASFIENKITSSPITLERELRSTRSSAKKANLSNSNTPLKKVSNLSAVAQTSKQNN